MRGPGNHTAPEYTQARPADNTSRHIEDQVTTWQTTGILVHDETAREIAAWWQSGSVRGYPFAAFQSTGTITDDLIPETWRLLREGTYDDESQPALLALLAYLYEAIA